MFLLYNLDTFRTFEWFTALREWEKLGLSEKPAETDLPLTSVT